MKDNAFEKNLIGCLCLLSIQALICTKSKWTRLKVVKGTIDQHKTAVILEFNQNSYLSTRDISPINAQLVVNQVRKIFFFINRARLN